MRQVSMVFLATVLVSVLLSGSIYNFSVPKIEGGNQSLSAFQGKKLLVITLPVEQSASADSLLYSLDTLGIAHNSELQIVAVPSYEDGYTPAIKTQLQQWYRSKLGNHILITGGMYTRSTSGPQQHPLFKWLTSVAQNEIFDIDVQGPGYKFFTNKSGQLYGLLRPHSKVGGASVQRTLQLQ